MPPAETPCPRDGAVEEQHGSRDGVPFSGPRGDRPGRDIAPPQSRTAYRVAKCTVARKPVVDVAVDPLTTSALR